MADIKISGLTPRVGELATTDLFEITIPGGTPLSRSVTGAKIVTLVGSDNLAGLADAPTALGNLGAEPAFSKNTGFNKTIGALAGNVAEGNHLHAGVYEPADGTILKDADIGGSVQAHAAVLDATTVAFTTAKDGVLSSALQPTDSVGDLSDVNLAGVAENNVLVYEGGGFVVKSILEAQNAIINGLGTGIVSGGELSINVDTTKFDISDGYGIVVDHSVPAVPVFTRVEWVGLTGLSVTDIATEASTAVAINAAGVVVQQTGGFNEVQHRTLITLGGLAHLDNVNVDSAFANKVPAYDANVSIFSLAKAIGEINLTGNVYSANGANLSVDRTGGTIYSYGRNVDNNTQDPSTVTQIASSGAFLLRMYADGAGGEVVEAGTEVVPAFYDDGSGTLATVTGGGNNFSNVGLYVYSNTGLTVLQYGCVRYKTLDAAISGIPSEKCMALPALSSALLRGWITVRYDTTDLTDAVDAVFTEANKFSSNVAGGTVGIGSVFEDGTPQLGGPLDVNTFAIVSSANGDIPITPNGTGNIILDGVNWPQADGLDGFTLKTNGAGQLAWEAASSGIFILKTANYTAEAGDSIACNTLGGAFTITLPVSAIAGDQVQIMDDGGSFGVNTLTVGRNGHNIQSLAEDMLISTASTNLFLQYVDGTIGWNVFGQISSGMDQVQSDTTPVLGGNLDGDGNDITNVANILTTGEIDLANNRAIRFSNASASQLGQGQMYVNASDDVIIHAGATAITLDGTTQNSIFAAGVSFNGDTAIVNTLDDYEEGTWTPRLTDGANNLTMNTSTGTYTKIGNMVTLFGRLDSSSLNGASGGITIQDLPFTCNSTHAGNMTTAHTTNVAMGAAGYSIVGHIGISSALINLFLWDRSDGISTMQASEWTALGKIWFTAIYYV